MSELKTLRKASAVAARPPVGNMPFIVSSNGDKANPTTRRLIRSHVMRGKKKKKKEMTAGISPSRGREGNGIGTSTGPVQRDPVNLEELFKTHMPLLPGRLGTRLYYLDFPDDIDSSVIMQMIQVSKVAMKIISPLLASIGFHGEGGAARHPVGFDTAALHINAYALENFIDRILRRRPDATVNPDAAQHHQRGLQLLRQKLLGDDEEERISDATVSAVLKLASASHFDGDVATSKQHIQGLRKMVDLRGGLDAFNHHPRLRTEMLRCDLGIALLTDSKPEFFLQPSEPIPEYPAQLSSKPITKLRPEQGLNFISMLDEDLAEAWRTTRSFCLLANLGTQTRMLLPPETIHGTMTAVMYRLFHMGFASGSFNETVRLGLLVSTYHIFLQWQDIRPPLLMASLRRTTKVSAVTCLMTMVWLLTVGAVSLFNIFEDDWLRDSLREHLDICQVRTWKELQEILKSQLWIQQLDDKSGKHVYDSLSGSLNPQVDKEEVRMWLEEVIETPTEQAQQ
ncbi:hypothetical protein PG988_012124 [Apiospora saccharicola]